MYLLVGVGEPHHIHTEAVEVALAGFGEHALEVSAVERGGVEAFAAIVVAASVVEVVGAVAVAEAVGDHEVYRGTPPVESPQAE